MQEGFINRTPRGRVATESAYDYIGSPYAKKDVAGKTTKQDKLW
jgi:hypothetical protein